ncbi:MAG: hypothetical protein methR_P1319 [Methyloprofundus sp.]|nr:MAG: hypothetical protein methR_P1319 [Methyloprofundus sp.]
MQKLILPTFWVISLIGMFILSDSFSDKSQHFFGIAGEREQTISFQYPVEVVRVFGRAGAEIEQGAPILEVRRQQLNAELATISQEIRQHELQKQETNNTINSQLAGLSAKKQAIIADMDRQIHTLEFRLQINANMLNSMTENQVNPVVINDNTELADLKKKRRYLIAGVQAEIGHLTEQLHSSSRPIDAQINELYHRQRDLQRQDVSLKVTALFDGRIGNVNFKAGELVPPYQPIISVQSKIPRYVKGYIHENILNDVQIGQAVWVKSIAQHQAVPTIMGVVESLGKRIIEYPDRLKKNPMIPTWGREVVVRLNNLQHSLLFGEKVEVLLEHPPLATAVALGISTANAAVNIPAVVLPITTNNSAVKLGTIEASGVVWNSQAGHYLLVSDEQHQGKPGVFIMQDEGVITARLKMRKNLDIDDLESISFDGDYVYILSSSSHSANGNLKSKRKKLVRFQYQDQQVIKQQAVDFYAILKDIRDRQLSVDLMTFLNQAITEQTLDIESHFVENNTLYIGFKAPNIGSDNTLIIKIDNVDALFSGAMPHAEIWQTFKLLNPETGEPMRLSDMIHINDQLILLSTSPSVMKNSVLWRYQLDSGKLTKIRQFHDLQAEGLAYNPEKSLLTVVFDEGSHLTSKYIKLFFPASCGLR